MAALYTLSFALALFASAALLFFIQPLVGKLLLPRLGGGAAVWNACLVFFQVMLLLGYAYAHASIRLLGARLQATVHLGLVVLAALPWLGSGTDLAARASDWAAPASSNPFGAVLLLLFSLVGLPFFVIASTAPLLQRWFVDSGHPEHADPYFLYAASNLGSMVALVSYPWLIEPAFPLSAQNRWWLVGYGVLAAFVAVCAALLWVGRPVFGAPAPAPADEEKKPVDEGALLTGQTAAIVQRLRWLALAAVPAGLLVALNTYVFTDIAALPLFWVVPLGLYLFTFIVAFSRQALLGRLSWVGKLVLQLVHGGLIFIMLVVLFLAAVMARDSRTDGNVVLLMALAVTLLGLLMVVPQNWLMALQPLVTVILMYVMWTEFSPLWGAALPLHLLCFYLAARGCHGELAADRPGGAGVTGFFLWVALGGALGGLFSAVLAPLIFTSGPTEYWILLVLACMLRPGSLVNGGTDALLAMAMNTGSRAPQRERRRLKNILALIFDWAVPVLVAGLALVVLLVAAGGRSGSPVLGNVLAFGLPLFLALTVVVRRFRFGLTLGLVALAIGLQYDSIRSGGYRGPSGERVLLRTRNFYGTIKVVARDVPPGRGGAMPLGPVREHALTQGTTHQGSNLVKPPELRRVATTYYHRDGPVGEVMRRYDWFGDRPRHDGFGPPPQGQQRYPSDARVAASLVGLLGGEALGGMIPTALPVGTLAGAQLEPPLGVIGLGVGTMAAYARPFQVVHFYELDPAIKDLCAPADSREPPFYFLRDATRRGADVKVFVGDGRAALAREAPDGFYGVLVVDAFDSDAIPVHLVTREAIELYMRKLAPGGVLCLHVSNRYVVLEPVVADVAMSLGIHARRGRDSGGERGGDPLAQAHSASEWIMLARDRQALDHLQNRDAPQQGDHRHFDDGLRWISPAPTGQHLWTDDYTNLSAVTRDNLPGVLVLLSWALIVLGVLVVLWEVVSALICLGLGPPRKPAPPVLQPAEVIDAIPTVRLMPPGGPPDAYRGGDRSGGM